MLLNFLVIKEFGNNFHINNKNKCFLHKDISILERLVKDHVTLNIGVM